MPCAEIKRIGLRRLIHVDELLSVSATMLRQPEPLTAALFVLGLAYCLPRLKDLKYWAGLSWVILTFIFGG